MLTTLCSPIEQLLLMNITEITDETISVCKYFIDFCFDCCIFIILFIFYILYFIFYILYFIFYILYFIFYILYFIFYILYFIFYILYFIFYILYFISVTNNFLGLLKEPSQPTNSRCVRLVTRSPSLQFS